MSYNSGIMKRKKISAILLFLFTVAVLYSVDSAESMVSQSSIESAYRDIGIEQADNLNQFGYDYFGRWAPSVTGPIDSSYVVGPGDVLRIYVWGEPVEFGELENSYEIPVAQDGRLFFPPVGRISVWGSTIDRVREVITEQLRRRFRNFEIDIVPAEVRQIPIFVSGFVASPGVVQATSIWSVLDILSEAGGITKDGSLRDIRLIRRDGTVIPVDLYDLFLFGRGALPRIQEGDIVMVPPVGSVAAAGGEVVRPAIYELAQGETVADLLQFSGGVKLSGSSQRGTLLRRDGEGYIVSEGSSLTEAFLDHRLESGDLLLFAQGASARADLVSVKGSVLYPGVYSLDETRTLSALLEKARVRPDTDLSYGTIMRNFPQDNENPYIVFNPAEVLDPDHAADYTLTFMDTVELYRKESSLPRAPIQVFGEIQGGITAYRQGITLLDVLSERNVAQPAMYQARIIRDGETMDPILLRDLMVRADMDHNIELMPGDKVVIVRNDELAYDEGSIRVLGNVGTPGVFSLIPGMRLADALERAGGFEDRAYPRGMVVMRDSVRKQQVEQFLQSASMLERQIEQLAQAIDGQSLSADIRISLQSQIVQQRTILDLAYERSEEAFGRIALGIREIDSPDHIRNTPDDILLEDGDYIFVPKTPGYVMVMGDINSGIAVPYDETKTVRDYLNDVGSIDTRSHRIMLLRVNGKVVNGEKTFFGGTTLARNTLQPGDVIFAQREIKIPTGITFRNHMLDLINAVGSVSTTVLTTMNLIDRLSE